jgi:hypothetical protein
MIDDLDDALRDLLVRELPIRDNEVDIAFDQPRREWSARLSRPSLNLYLYDNREKLRLRREATQREVERRPSSVITERRPTRLDLYYLVTAWATAPEDEHRLLSRALMTFLRYPELPDDALPTSLRDQPNPIPLKVAQPDTLDKPSDLWSVLDNQQRPGLVLVVTLAFSPYAPTEQPLTRTAEFGFRQADGTPGGMSHGYTSISFQVRSQRPLANVQVKVLERGDLAARDSNGEFAIRNLTPGDYTLQITADGYPASQHKIKVPAANYDIDL